MRDVRKKQVKKRDEGYNGREKLQLQEDIIFLSSSLNLLTVTAVQPTSTLDTTGHFIKVEGVNRLHMNQKTAKVIVGV